MNKREKVIAGTWKSKGTEHEEWQKFLERLEELLVYMTKNLKFLYL